MKKTDCGEVKKMLDMAELRLELSRSQREELEHHLALCGECRRLLEGEQRFSELIEDSLISFAQGNGELAGRICGSLPERSAPVPNSHQFLPRKVRNPSVLTAAAAVILFCLGIFVGWLFNGPAEKLQNNDNGFTAGTNQSTTGEQPRFIGTGNRAHKVLPENRLKTSERRKFRFIIPGHSNVRIEVDHEEYRLEDLFPVNPESYEKIAY